MHRVAISSTGIFTPPEVITNAELVASYNAYAALQNARHADEIAAGTRVALTDSSVEFIEKASGIQRRYVMEKPVCWTLSACARTSRPGLTPRFR